jgi:hypothetical protein
MAHTLNMLARLGRYWGGRHGVSGREERPSSPVPRKPSRPGPRGSSLSPVAAGTRRAAWPLLLGVVVHMPRYAGVVGPMPRGPAAVFWGLWPTCPDTRGSWATHPTRDPRSGPGNGTVLGRAITLPLSPVGPPAGISSPGTGPRRSRSRRRGSRGSAAAWDRTEGGRAAGDQPGRDRAQQDREPRAL